MWLAAARATSGTLAQARSSGPLRLGPMTPTFSFIAGYDALEALQKDNAAMDTRPEQSRSKALCGKFGLLHVAGGQN